MGFGLCHVILGNRGGPARGWFSEEWPPAPALVGGEVPPARGGVLPPARVPGCSREKALGGDKALLFHGKESFCSQNLLTALGKWKGCFFFFFPPELFLLTMLLFFVPETREVVRDARSHCLADLPPPTESQGQSCLPSLGGGGGQWVCDRPIEEVLKQSLKTHRQAGSSPLEKLFRNLTIN